MKNEAKTTTTATKGCASCGAVQLPVGILTCSPCTRYNLMLFFESHPWLRGR